MNEQMPREIAETDLFPHIERTVKFIDMAWMHRRWPKRKIELGQHVVRFDGHGDQVRFHTRDWSLTSEVYESQEFRPAAGMLVKHNLASRPVKFAGDLDACLRDLTVMKLGWE